MDGPGQRESGDVREGKHAPAAGRRDAAGIGIDAPVGGQSKAVRRPAGTGVSRSSPGQHAEKQQVVPRLCSPKQQQGLTDMRSMWQTHEVTA